ncbi:MAG: HEAT repeat domain-containing protein [Tepidiformaceae bacterium]
MPIATAREFSSVLERLPEGHVPTAAEMAVFSGLSRAESAQLVPEWTALAGDQREILMTIAVALSTDSVDYDFSALARIALADASPRVREHAAELLWESNDAAVGSQLAGLLRDDPDSAVRAAAAASLKQFVTLREFDRLDEAAGDAIVDRLRAAAEDPAEELPVRANAVESLGPRSLPFVPMLIEDAYTADERDLRLAAVRAMGDTADERWVEYLLEQFYAEDPEFRFAAALSAGEIGSEDAVEPLAGLLKDPDLDVVLGAIGALADIAGEDAVRALKGFERHAPEEVAGALHEAIELAAENTPGLDLEELDDEADRDEFDEIDYEAAEFDEPDFE